MVRTSGKKQYRLAPLLASAALMAAVSGSWAAEPVSLPAPQPAPQKDLYAVGYAHLDTQWRWAYPQVIREFIANTMKDNFKLIEKYPHYIFNFSGSRRYEMMKEYYPKDYEKVRQYIKDGRWFPCGSSVDEADGLVPSAESMVRHILYGNAYFQREFGVVSREFMLPDCFGFSAALPSLLVHSGIQGFSTQKLTWGSAAGIPFKVGQWQGPDGKSLLAALDPGAYVGSVTEDLSQSASWLARINKTGEKSGTYVDYHYYGTGDCGGAPKEASVQWMEKSVAGTGPIHVISANAEAMFLKIPPQQAAAMPHYQGELLLTEHSAGSITSQAYMKRWNRKNELLADAAERASVAANWLGAAPYPGPKLYTAWDLLLGSQMHDMLPGTSLPKGYEFCWNDEILAGQSFATIAQDAVGAVTSAMDTRAKGVALVIYNPLSIEREDVVEASVRFAGAHPPTALSVLAPDGSEVPGQIVSCEGGVAKVLLLAKVPANGMAVYDLQFSASATTETGSLSARENQLENEHFRVTLNADGDIASIVDKATGKETLQGPARLSLQYENPRAYPAWNMDWTDRKNPPRAYVSGPASFKVIESGAVRVTLEVTREFEGSRYVQQIRLARGGRSVEVNTILDWQGKESSLKASFPLVAGNPTATYDGQLGVVERGNNEPKKYEVPQHQWLDLSDGSGGAAILNDCKFGSDKPDDHTVRLTLVYTPGVRAGFGDQATQDHGRHQMLYAIAPHAGDWRSAQIPWQAARLNQPLRAFTCPAHPGRLGRSYSLLNLSSSQVAVTAIKKAEASDEIIVRLRELEGKALSALELKFPNAAILSAREVNGQEQPLSEARVQHGAMVTDMGAFSLRAFALKLAPPETLLAAPVSASVELPFDTDAVSSDAAPADGAMDAEGRTLSAEQLGTQVVSDGIVFKIGPTEPGAKNAVSCRGQKITLPAASETQRIYLLAAASGADVPARFACGSETRDLTIQNWTGYIGQWDNRQWEGKIPEKAFNITNECNGLVPGYIKPAEVAWYASHIHHPSQGNTFYQYGYLFKYALDLPAGATSITLPDDPRVKIFAVTVAQNAHDSAVAARELFDDFSDRKVSAPRLSRASGKYSDAQRVTLDHPLYWQEGGLHYTLDGSDPTAASPTYTTPLALTATTLLKAAEIDAAGHVGPVAEARLEIADTTPPKVLKAQRLATEAQVLVSFSEPVDKAMAQTPGNYQFQPALEVHSAKLSEDGCSVELTLGTGSPTQLQVVGVKDVAGNALAPEAVNVTTSGVIFSMARCEPGKTLEIPLETLPLKARDSWTLNLFCQMDSQPENRTLIAGFGQARDQDSADGTGRYLAKFANGVHFWSRGRDAESTTALDLGAWQMLTVVYDGKTLRLYKNGQSIGSKALKLERDEDRVLRIAPPDAWDAQRIFAGKIRDVSLFDRAVSAKTLQLLWEQGKEAK